MKFALGENSSVKQGEQVERQAELWFLEKFPAARLVVRNYRRKTGEIDLIFEEEGRANGGELIFVEVRARTLDSMQTGIASVGFRKRLRLYRTIQAFLRDYTGTAREIRFDILWWTGEAWVHAPQIWPLV